ncbi:MULTISPECIES: hydroxyisourate hydrolase [unclassified Acinetobacter]|uniref:hydroxyisourate hydrolase n=1 Tax=unclassified Acinetobacter TaxID=196816 RepID=UPI00190A59C3|nr:MULTISPECIES: hydroxyisourate hydrolase [unclassified Acinetobacter]MBK0063882.1 hydroxyisourate hydrolase [Acinetobacter sp. S55]MBK0067050.1 hydroxyisourate hydrolase [Acinetobacter sp. S54]
MVKNPVYKTIFFALSLAATTLTFAQNPLSVHVLNLENGLPSSDVNVVLEAQQGEKWVQINQAKTDENGRITALYPSDKAIDKGIYRVTFKTGDWFREHNQRSFFPEVPVVFVIDGTVDHYHIPLLMSPYGYSTYRGN